MDIAKGGVAPATRRDLYVAFRNALLSGSQYDWTLPEHVDQSAEAELPLVTVTRLVEDRANYKPDARDNIRTYLAAIAAKSGAKIRASTLAGNPGRLISGGEAAPRISDDFIYFGSNGGTDGEASLAIDTDAGGCAVLHCLAYITATAADHFYVSLEDARSDLSEAIRIGSGGVTMVRDFYALDIGGRTPRLYSLAVGGGFFSVYINGALVWRRKRPDAQRPAGLAFKLLGRTSSASTDGGVFEYEFWSLDAPFTGFDTDEQAHLDAWAGSLAAKAAVFPLYQLTRSISDFSLDTNEAAVIRAMTEAMGTIKGHPDWMFQTLEKALSPEGRARWTSVARGLTPAPIIDVENVSVSFSRNPSADLSLWRHLRRRPTNHFPVLSGVNFQAYPGDVVGVIGHNGAGKSTLLRTLAGLVPIKTGKILVRGNHMLLRGGLGLRLELSGRENIVSLGIYMGLSYRRIMALVDEIIDFAELADHIDKPAKYYSDGMLSRLVFSTATSVSPEILMLDELLGAGDIKFQDKAQKRLREFMNRSKLVIVVTHSVAFVREQCNKAMVLSNGRQIYFGEPVQAVSTYLADLHLSPADAGKIDATTHF